MANCASKSRQAWWYLAAAIVGNFASMPAVEFPQFMLALVEIDSSAC
jgi:hypothetical protein